MDPDDEFIGPEVTALLRELGNPSHMEDHEAGLLRAYVAYHFPTHETAHVNIEQELNKVLERDPNEVTAQLYLGHYYCDNGQFAEAKKAFLQIDTELYRAANQGWRALKIEELMLTASIWLGDDKALAEKLNGLITRMEACDLVDLAIPSGLVTALSKNLDKLKTIYGAETVRTIADRLRDLIWTKFGPDVLVDEFENIARASC
jgi:hypothetical protein